MCFVPFLCCPFFFFRIFLNLLYFRTVTLEASGCLCVHSQVAPNIYRLSGRAQPCNEKAPGIVWHIELHPYVRSPTFSLHDVVTKGGEGVTQVSFQPVVKNFSESKTLTFNFSITLWMGGHRGFILHNIVNRGVTGFILRAAQLFYDAVTLTLFHDIMTGGGGHTGFILRAAQLFHDMTLTLFHDILTGGSHRFHSQGS